MLLNKTKFTQEPLCRALLVALSFSPAVPVYAFDSGSSGNDGTLNPTVDTEVQLPDDGILEYTTVTIPRGITVTFKKNTTNTPVTILASGDVTIEGHISVNASSLPTKVGTAGDGNIADDGIAGTGGPGGFDGGRGGKVGQTNSSGCGLGPGGACGNKSAANYNYSSDYLLPLVGGSGGSGGYGGTNFTGQGGYGGGGAILIASSGLITVNGSITADSPWQSNGAEGTGVGHVGGYASGGAIRLVATGIAGKGSLSALGKGSRQYKIFNGKIRLEAETNNYTGSSRPAYKFGAPSALFISGLPGVKITKVGGVAVPEQPTGKADVVLPKTASNPITVDFETKGVPIGNIVSLRVVPAYGKSTTVVTPALSGTTDKATTSVAVDIPDGATTLSASVTYTVTVAAVKQSLSEFAGFNVAQIRYDAWVGQQKDNAILIGENGEKKTISRAYLAQLQLMNRG